MIQAGNPNGVEGIKIMTISQNHRLNIRFNIVATITDNLLVECATDWLSSLRKLS